MSEAEPINPYDSPEHTRGGMSTGGKVLLALGITFGVVLLLCCGGLGGGGYWFYSVMRDSVTTDPEAIQKITNEIAAIEIPESFKPEMGFNLEVPFTEKKDVKFVTYANASRDGSLVLAQFDESIASEAQMRDQLNVQLNNRNQGSNEPIDIRESEKLELEINGKPASFTVARGESRRTNKEFWQVIGNFRGKGGPAMLIFVTPAEGFDKDAVMKLVHSIK